MSATVTYKKWHVNTIDFFSKRNRLTPGGALQLLEPFRTRHCFYRQCMAHCFRIDRWRARKALWLWDGFLSHTLTQTHTIFLSLSLKLSLSLPLSLSLKLHKISFQMKPKRCFNVSTDVQHRYKSTSTTLTSRNCLTHILRRPWKMLKRPWRQRRPLHRRTFFRLLSNRD